LNNIQYFRQNIHYFEYFEGFCEYSLQIISADFLFFSGHVRVFSAYNSAIFTKSTNAAAIFVQTLKIVYLFK